MSVDGGAAGGGGGALAAADDAEVTVRLARREDMPLVHQMIHELAEFEGIPEAPQLSAADLVADGFDATPPWFFVLLAERRGEPLGQALASRSYSSWTRRAFHLEDLYVRPAARRAGVGSALMRHLCQMAVAEGAATVDWRVLLSNAAARAFYGRLGAHDECAGAGRAGLRLHAPQIAALARGRRH